MKQENYIYRKVNRGFQITLPPEFRDKYDLKIGSTLCLSLEDNKLIVTPYIDDKTHALKRLQMIFAEIDKLPQLPQSEDELYDLLDTERKSTRDHRE